MSVSKINFGMEGKTIFRIIPTPRDQVVLVLQPDPKLRDVRFGTIFSINDGQVIHEFRNYCLDYVQGLAVGLARGKNLDLVRIDLPDGDAAELLAYDLDAKNDSGNRFTASLWCQPNK